MAKPKRKDKLMNMVLPKSHVVMSNEEMHYTDGGWEFTGLYNGVVSFGVNSVVNAFFGGGTISLIKKAFGPAMMKMKVKDAVMQWLSVRASNAVASLFGSLMNGFLSWSVGDAVAKIWDGNDTNRNNGICGSLW